MFNLFKKTALGLNISDHSIEMISFSGSLKDPCLLAMGRVVLEPGIVENGKIVNKRSLKAALRDLLARPEIGRVKTAKIIFALPEAKTFVDISKIPQDLKEKEIAEIVNSRVAQTFPYPSEELYYDFLIKDRDDTREIFLAAASKNIVDDYLEVFKDLKLRSLVLETESESLARSLIADKNEVVLIIDVGARFTNFSIFDRQELRLSISNEIAGDRFTQSLAEELKVSRSEAEKIKRKNGLDPGAKEARVFLILQKDIQMGIIWEFRRIDKYFQKKENKKISRIILTGGSSLLPRLKDYLTDNLEKKVALGDSYAKINADILKQKKYQAESIFYATVVGTALRGLAKDYKKIGINLIKGRR